MKRSRLTREFGDGPRLTLWCPGCGHEKHVPVLDHPDAWQWNGNEEHPTLYPSIDQTARWPEGVRRCHSFVRGGSIQYLGDCTHALAGQTVDLPPVDREEREAGG